VAVLIDDRRLGACAAKRRSECEDELQILIGFLVAKDALCHLKKASDLDQGEHARAKRRLEHILPRPAEAESTKAGFIGNAEKIVAFEEGSDRAAFTLSEVTLGALHEATPPSIGSRVTDGPEDGSSGWRRKAAARQYQGRLDRKAVRIIDPLQRVLEHDRLVASHLVAARQADWTCPSFEIDMDFDVSHDRLDPVRA
jgi:hypothetical protein